MQQALQLIKTKFVNLMKHINLYSQDISYIPTRTNTGPHRSKWGWCYLPRSIHFLSCWLETAFTKAYPRVTWRRKQRKTKRRFGNQLECLCCHYAHFVCKHAHTHTHTKHAIFCFELPDFQNSQYMREFVFQSMNKCEFVRKIKLQLNSITTKSQIVKG